MDVGGTTRQEQMRILECLRFCATIKSRVFAGPIAKLVSHRNLATALLSECIDQVPTLFVEQHFRLTRNAILREPASALIGRSIGSSETPAVFLPSNPGAVLECRIAYIPW